MLDESKNPLLQSFDWCYIPSGEVVLTSHAPDGNIYIKQSTLIDVPAFYMAKYPITNTQYREFVNEGGAIPFYWHDDNWNGDDYPVIGVTWYEAIKFCRWLSDKTGETIMLPNDAMWQRAAQGDDGRHYPWGNTWDANLCNHNVGNIGTTRTTPVNRYEGVGDSPFGVVDMARNVWEWCLTAYSTGKNVLSGSHTDDRILRGGSWYSIKFYVQLCTRHLFDGVTRFLLLRLKRCHPNRHNH